jgi:hypothetical protein
MVPQHVLSRKAAGETVLLNLRTEEYFGLGEVGTRIWDLLVEGESHREIVDALSEEYGVEPEVIDSDLGRLVSQLTESDLLDWGRETADTWRSDGKG